MTTMKNLSKILIVEDEKDLREALRDVLDSENYSVLEAGTGAEGVKTALSEHPDLILLDILMPEMDGITALKKIRKDAWGKSAKVIILTNLNPSQERIITDLITNEPLDYLIKSDWKIYDVVKKIEEALRPDVS